MNGNDSMPAAAGAAEERRHVLGLAAIDHLRTGTPSRSAYERDPMLSLVAKSRSDRAPELTLMIATRRARKTGQ